MRLALDRVQAATEALLVQFGVGRRRYQAMLALDVAGTASGLTVAGLGRKIGLRPNSCTELLDRMETDGLALRVRDRGDRRIVRARLTLEGTKLVRQIAGAERVILSRMSSEFPALPANSDSQRKKTPARTPGP
ncbi:MAG: MarR family winged helix-turn-helix transcriptional regulator [Beijerinckiaceae bacterium]